MLQIEQIPVLQDNYIYVLHDQATNTTAVVDPAVAPPVLSLLEAKGWTLDHILNTHHHHDHVGGNLELKEATGCSITGFGDDATRIPGIDHHVRAGDHVYVGESSADVLFVPGHTLGHIAYYFAKDKALFCGDTLFSMGCGRLFEGTPTQMYHSLAQFTALPEDTNIYCAHEYTQDNGRFALTLDPDNTDLQQRMKEVDQLRSEGKPTIPNSIASEKKTNPFLRAHDPAIQANLGLTSNDPIDVFAEIRQRKDDRF